MTTIPRLELAGPGNNGQDSCPFFQQWRWQFFFSVLLFVFGYYGVYVNEFEFMSHSLPSALKTLNNSVHKVFVLLLFFCMSYAFFCFLQFSLLYSAILSSLLLHPTKMSFSTSKKKTQAIRTDDIIVSYVIYWCLRFIFSTKCLNNITALCIFSYLFEKNACSQQSIRYSENRIDKTPTKYIIPICLLLFMCWLILFYFMCSHHKRHCFERHHPL